ncbi:hypothetical protein BJX99DRAFT_258261 [Aspergillus californicus]
MQLHWSTLRSERYLNQVHNNVSCDTTIDWDICAQIKLPRSDSVDFSAVAEFPAPPHATENMETLSPSAVEECWYDCLTVISQRCILDRIPNAFTPSDRLVLPPGQMVQIASEFDQELLATAANLPSELQYTEDGTTIRELPIPTHGRMIRAQVLIFRPFVYRVLHS